MGVRTITHPPFLASVAAAPLGAAYWLLVEPATVLGQTAAIVIGLGAGAAAVWLLAVGLAYHLHRRRYQRVLAAEGAVRGPRWLTVRRPASLRVRRAAATPASATNTLRRPATV